MNNFLVKIYFAIIFLTTSLYAQISVTASVDSRNIQKQDIVYYEITINNANFAPNFNLPKMNDFTVINGPSESSNLQWINGKKTSSVSFSWQLSPKRNGALSIPAISISINRKTYKTRTIQINVGTSPLLNQSSAEKDIFLSLDLDKFDIYIGEQITGTLNLYSRVDVSGYEIPKEPAAVGFLKEEISKPRRPQSKQTTVNGVSYSVFMMMKIAFFPMRTGELIIDEYEMLVSIKVRTKSRRKSIFDDPFFNSSRTQNKKLRTKAQNIIVKPSPKKNKPASFTGLVGQFNLRSEIDRTEIQENDAFRFTMKISGAGNWRSAAIPKPIFPVGFDVFKPKITDKVRYSSEKLRGSKTFEYVVIPRTSGEFTIPAQEMAYFDPKQNNYRTKRTKSFSISVLPGDGFTSSGTFSPEEIEILSQDIRFIHTETNLRKSVHKPVSFWLLNGFIGLFFFGGLALQIRQKQSSNLDWKTQKQVKGAFRQFSQTLKKALQELKLGDLDKYFSYSALAIRTYFRQRLQISEHETDSENLRSKLLISGISEDEVKVILQIFQIFESGRYSPGVSNGLNELEKLLVTLRNTIKEIDCQI